MKYEIGEAYGQALTDISAVIHQANVDAGWWQDLYDVCDIIMSCPTIGAEERNLLTRKVVMWFEMTKLALIHSEISEMCEGIRKGKMDSHLPWREASEVEGADAFIRLADLMAARGEDLGGATDEKFTYNQGRADHKKEHREGENGKLV
jgi:hypothetical protein